MAGNCGSSLSGGRAPRDKSVILSRRGRAPHGTNASSLAFIKLTGVGGPGVAVYVAFHRAPLRRSVCRHTWSVSNIPLPDNDSPDSSSPVWILRLCMRLYKRFGALWVCQWNTMLLEYTERLL